MARFPVGRSTSGAHVIFTLCVIMLSFGGFVQGCADSIKYSEYVSTRTNVQKLFDGLSLQSEFTLSAIKEVVSIKKTLDNMVTEGVLEQIKQDISSWLPTILNYSDINILENMLEMREQAIRSVENEVESYNSTITEVIIAPTNNSDQCAWVNYRVLNNCNSTTESDLNPQQNTTKTFFIDGQECFHNGPTDDHQPCNSAFYLCHSGTR